jgi:acyl-coenzyme A synthetase/AMP-(fatty) acid ligase
MPKKISHTFNSLTRMVRTGENNSNDIWGLAYNPTHIAGLQVFFQALLNLNSIVRLFGLSRTDIYNQIDNYTLTSISATPTFYRLLIPYENKFDSVKRITSGGEKFEPKLSEDIKLIFPQAKLLNIYASTEAGTIFASLNDHFVLKNEYKALVKIDDLELCIHKDLLGTSDSFTFEDDWYRTGDLVEVIKNEPLTFKFISRKNELINVGGYKVNPAEVELSLNSHPGVALSRVYARKNSVTGNIVIAEVKKKEPQLEEKALRLFLSERLQSFKIPRIINFVESIDTTYTGKLKRL